MREHLAYWSFVSEARCCKCLPLTSRVLLQTRFLAPCRPKAAVAWRSIALFKHAGGKEHGPSHIFVLGKALCIILQDGEGEKKARMELKQPLSLSSIKDPRRRRMKKRNRNFLWEIVCVPRLHSTFLCRVKKVFPAEALPAVWQKSKNTWRCIGFWETTDSLLRKNTCKLLMCLDC